MLQLVTQYTSLLTHFAQASCQLPGQVFGIPTWYKYLPGQTDVATGTCQVSPDINIFNMSSLLSIGVAVIEILLRVGALVAVGYIIYAGFMYITSNGDPERAKSAKDTILNALIGLVIVIAATAIVSFIGSSLGG